MEQDLDCFLFVDLETPEEERTMSVTCVECHEEKIPDTGFFYEGSKEGYSDYDWVCCFCGKIIHKSSEEEKDGKEIETSG